MDSPKSGPYEDSPSGSPSSSSPRPIGALDGLRVLDLADEKGVFCGKLLADMGADVIKIEPPGGDPVRERGPFAKSTSATDISLYSLYHNTNKRSITLNLESPKGQELL